MQDYFEDEDSDDEGPPRRFSRWDDGSSTFMDLMAEVSSEDEAMACAEAEQNPNCGTRSKKIILADYYRYLINYCHPTRALFSPFHMAGRDGSNTLLMLTSR